MRHTTYACAVLYENSSPFAHVPELEREIEISHWGQVYFEERYTLVRTVPHNPVLPTCPLFPASHTCLAQPPDCSS
jgi:hypothetical protein